MAPVVEAFHDRRLVMLADQNFWPTLTPIVIGWIGIT